MNLIRSITYKKYTVNNELLQFMLYELKNDRKTKKAVKNKKVATVCLFALFCMRIENIMMVRKNLLPCLLFVNPG